MERHRLVKVRTPRSALQRIGREIAETRKARGMTQAAVADIIGTSRSTLSRIENGMVEGDSERHTAILRRLVNLLGPFENLMMYTPKLPDLSTYDQWTRI